jgi:hypothetical protein
MMAILLVSIKTLRRDRRQDRRRFVIKKQASVVLACSMQRK